MKLTEESILLIKNWQAYEFIRQSGESLNQQISSTMKEVEGHLHKRSWWNAGLMTYSDESELFIRMKSWTAANGWARLAIGVYALDPPHLFGNAEECADLYVWIHEPKKNRSLRMAVVDILKGSKKRLHGDLDEGDGEYIVRQKIPKIYGEDSHRFEEVAIKPILQWFDFYAEFIPAFDKAVKASRKE